MKLLLVEDNRPLADRLKKRLSEHFIVDAVHNGTDGLEHVRSNSYDAIVLDLTLPDMTGLQVCRTIREEGLHIPILILTGIDEVASRVELLDAGADDYLTKPFNTPELRARLQALLRRSSPTYTSGVLTIQDLTLDIDRRYVTRAGDTIDLRRKEFDILEYLVRNRGRVVTRAMILDHVWEANKESWPNTIDVHIKHLRDKVDRPYKVPLIRTAYGIGYLVDDEQTK
jgi:DNA-binding response OmpR family regulator